MSMISLMGETAPRAWLYTSTRWVPTVASYQLSLLLSWAATRTSVFMLHMVVMMLRSGSSTLVVLVHCTSSTGNTAATRPMLPPAAKDWK